MKTRESGWSEKSRLLWEIYREIEKISFGFSRISFPVSTSLTTTSTTVVEETSVVPAPSLYRNLEGDNFLPYLDYAGRTLPLETSITLVESGTDSGGQFYIIDNTPSIESLVANPPKWGIWSMTIQPQPDDVMRRIKKVSYLGTYSGHTNCVKVWTYGAIASAASSNKMALALPGAGHSIIKNSVEFERNTGAWNATFVNGGATWKHSNGTYYALIAGYNSGASVPKVKHHLFTASSFMGSWSDITGAGNGDCMALSYPEGYAGFNPVQGCFPVPGQSGYYAAPIALVKEDGSMDYGMITFDEDFSDVTAFPVNINYTQLNPPYSYYYSAIYHRGKYYYQIHDGTYNSGKRVVLASNTLNGTYSYHSTLFDFGEEWISNNGSMMRSAVGGGMFNIIGEKLYYFSSGQSGFPYEWTGNSGNHESFLFFFNNIRWERKSSPVMIANHGNASDFGFSWGKDHLGTISNMIVENHQAQFIIPMTDGTDAYHATPGYLRLTDTDQWNTSPDLRPMDIFLSANTIAENNLPGDSIGIFTTTNAEGESGYIYTLTTGTGSDDNTSFTIDGPNLKAAVSFDYEVKNSFSIRVRSTDSEGFYFEKTFTITITNVSETTLKNNLVSVWEFNETEGITALDSYASNNGALSGVTPNQAGKLDKCYDFDGNDIVTLPDAAKVTGAFSISMWINPDLWTGNAYRSIFGGIIFGSATTKGGIAIGQLYSSAALYAQIYSSSAVFSVYASRPSTGSWHHVVLTYDLDKLKLYINNSTPTGSAIATVGNITIDWTGMSGRPAKIGAAEQPVNTNCYFDGKIDQTLIWNRALTADEISMIYNSGNGLPYSNW